MVHFLSPASMYPTAGTFCNQGTTAEDPPVFNASTASLRSSSVAYRSMCILDGAAVAAAPSRTCPLAPNVSGGLFPTWLNPSAGSDNSSESMRNRRRMVSSFFGALQVGLLRVWAKAENCLETPSEAVVRRSHPFQDFARSGSDSRHAPGSSNSNAICHRPTERALNNAVGFARDASRESGDP